MENQPIIIEATFDAQITKVWQAISDINEMKQWYFDLEEFKPKVGFKFEFVGCPDSGTEYVHLCEVTAAKPNKILSYTWKYKGYEGNSEVRFELIDQVDQTLLKLTHEGLHTFPKDNPDLSIHSFVEGWNEIIHKNLKEYLYS
ncbi:MAG: SRPBCC family protein [Aquaticitalea sp.]